MKKWFWLVLIIFVVFVVCQKVLDGIRNASSDHNQIPHRWRPLKNGACMDFSDDRKFYVIYDRTLEKKLPDGSSILPFGVGVIPDMRQGGTSKLDLGNQRYPISENSVYWVSKYKDEAQVIVRPLNIDGLLEDFVSFSLDNARAQTKILSDEFTVFGGAEGRKSFIVFKTLSIADNDWHVLYSEAERIWIVNDGASDRCEIMLESTESAQKALVLSVGDKRVSLARDRLYWLTKAGGTILVEVEPFSLGHFLFQLNILIARGCGVSAKTPSSR